MCGIAGVLGVTDYPSVPAMERMLANMEHRGPDQGGLWRNSDSSVVFGHRRLSIIDLSEAGRQPMVDTASGVVLTYNGECYNYLELRRELAETGVQFTSKSDTEVLLKAYIVWGVDFIEKVRGMFALAIWDPRIRQTLLVRDRVGIKPIYYTNAGGGLLFASELRALLASGIVPRTLNTDAVAGYLSNGFIMGPETIVKGVERINPGTIIRVDEKGRIMERTNYWNLSRTADNLSSEDAAEICQLELERAVEEHMVSDVPLGVFLSGGVDSSAITALAQRSSDKPVTTFNISFTESEYDESGFAKQVAQRVGTDHRELILTEAKFYDQLECAVNSLDQPTFDAINTYFVSRAVREAGITVALAGTGGDELFGGYPSFRELRKARSITKALSILPRPLQKRLGQLAVSVASRHSGEVRPQVRWGKIADLLATQGNLLGLYQVSYALFTSDFQQELHRSTTARLEWGLSRERRKFLEESIKTEDEYLKQVSDLEMANFLGERLLPDTDAASMAVSLEVRVPLLDHRLIESLAALKTEDRFEPLGRKQFLRTAMMKELNPAMFDRPKAGFELPMEKWCRNQLSDDIEQTFRDINLVHSTGLDAESVMRLWRAFKSNARGLYWSRIWSIYVLVNWCKTNLVKAA